MRVFLGKNLNTKLQFVKIRVELLKLGYGYKKFCGSGLIGKDFEWFSA